MRKTILLSMLLMIGSLAFAQRGGNFNKGGRFQDQRACFAQELDLTEEQQSKIEELRLTHMEKVAATKNELKVKQAELEAALETNSPDKPKIDQLVKKINSLQNTLFSERISHRMQVRAALDDKQKLLYDQMDHRMFGPGRGRRG